MKLVIYLLLALLVFALVRAQWRGRGRVVSAEERNMSIRFSAFAWVLGFAFLAAFLFLPGKQAFLLLLPVFIFAVSFAKFWRDKRDRLRHENDERSRLERMKRVN